jgi:hypothetical protein
VHLARKWVKFWDITVHANETPGLIMGEILLKKDLEAIEFYRSDMSYGNSLGDV